MIQLITRQELEQNKPLTKQTGSLTDQHKDALIIKAQKVYLIPLLGNDFFNEVLREKDNAEYADLINGSTYENSNGQTRTHEGLKQLLYDYCWYVYNTESYLISTRAGNKSIQGESTRKPSKEEMQSLYADLLVEAKTTYVNIRVFLNQSNFTGWKKTDIKPRSTKVGGARTRTKTRSACVSRSSGGGGGTSPVNSVFGRIGDVTAQTGDYNTNQVTELNNLYYTEARVSNNPNVSQNTTKRTYPLEDEQKLANIEDNANNYVLPSDVVQDSNYVHTDNNFTDSNASKLNGIENNANNYVLPSDVVQDNDYVHTDNNFTDNNLSKLNGIENNANNYVLPNDVVQDNDYVHTDNNFTDNNLSKLNGIEVNANNYILPNTVLHNNQSATITASFTFQDQARFEDEIAISDGGGTTRTTINSDTINYTLPSGENGNANIQISQEGATIGGYQFDYDNAGSELSHYIYWGDEPGISDNRLEISDSTFSYKDNDVIHDGNLSDSLLNHRTIFQTAFIQNIRIINSFNLSPNNFNRYWLCENSADIIITIPQLTNVDIGTTIIFHQIDDGNIDFMPANDVTLNSINDLRRIGGKSGVVYLLYTETDVWELVGSLQ